MKNYEIWIGYHGVSTGENCPTKPQKLGEVVATSFNIACYLFELQGAIDNLKRRMENGDKYIEDIHFGRSYYKPENNSNSWTGKYYETEEEALKSF